MKRHLAAWLLVLSFQAAMAQPKGADPLKGILGSVQAGDYKFVQYDKGELQKKYLDELFKRSKQDHAYFLATVNQIDAEFKSLIKNTLFNSGDVIKEDVTELSPETKVGGLMWMSTQAKAGAKFFPAVYFAGSVNKFHQARLELESTIERLTAISKGALPSSSIRAEESGLKEVPNYGNVDFKAIAKFYNDKLDTLIKEVSNLQQNIIFPNKVEHIIKEGSGKGLELTVVGTLLPEEKILELEKKIRAARLPTPKMLKAMDDYTKFLKSKLQNFITTYGTTERWRADLSDDEKKQREADAKEIAEGFWAKSYLRAAYGTPNGTIGFYYDKKALHLDLFFNRNKDLAKFYDTPAWNEKEFIQIANSFSNAMERLDVRAKDLMDGDLSVIASAENLLTWIGGNRRLAQALQMMFILMAADLHEERLINRSDGLGRMKARYKARYLGTDEDKKFYISIRKSYDPQDEEERKNVPVIINPQSVYGHFTDVMTHLRAKEAAMQNIDAWQATIDAARGKSRFTIERKKRIDDLEGKD